MFRWYGLAGFTLIIASYIANFLRIDAFNTALFTTGFWLFFDSIDYSINKTSILHRMMKAHSMLPWLLAAGVFTGYVFEFFGRDISGLWVITNNPNLED